MNETNKFGIKHRLQEDILFLQLGAMLLTAVVCGQIMRRFHQPAVLGELLGGNITVTSRIDKGTTFRFKATFAVPVRAEGVATPHLPAGGKKILIAHDSPAARKILQMMANTFHIPFAMARTGHAVEQMLSAAITEGVPYDALFIGEALPDCTSVDLLERIDDDPRLRGIRTVLVGPFTDGVVKAVTRTVGVYSVLDRYSKQSEFYDAYCSVVGEPTSATASAAADSTDAAPAAPAEPVSPLRILVVDDNIVNQQVAADLLEAMGCRPDIAWNGEKALEMAMIRNYDIIFMDCQMPVMDGYESTRRIHQAAGVDQQGVIIAMTAHAIDGDREACFAAGMDDYIAKPIRFEDLRLMIEKWRKKIPQPQERPV